MEISDQFHAALPHKFKTVDWMSPSGRGDKEENRTGNKIPEVQGSGFINRAVLIHTFAFQK
jgi:hypothetical protein